MNKILLVVQREYLTRVRKKSFLIMTILGPLLMAALMIVPVWLATMSGEESKTFIVIDEGGLMQNKLTNTENVSFIFVNNSEEDGKKAINEEKFDGLLLIPTMDIQNPAAVKLYTQKNLGIELKTSIKKKIENVIEEKRFEASNIDKDLLKSLKVNIQFDTFTLSENTVKNSSSEAATVISFIGGFMIYMFIFMYGVQVLRGVMEEKTNRIVEVVISSIKPFQLMMGKILGISAVGLTQFLLWIILTAAISGALSSYFKVDRFSNAQLTETLQSTPDVKQAMEMNKIVTAIDSINFKLIIGGFLFYFLGGYLLYGALFAAIGAAVDSETDTQQFMLPITIPLILSFVVAQNIMKAPDSSMAFWFSIIPFTSPISMMIRIPFGVPAWELALSMIIINNWLYRNHMGCRANLYRVGILMYGKKVSYKELSKWLFYKI
jgi:ABC-2 type transport system permease protein